MTGFPETRGSLVAAMKSGDQRERTRALETLAGAYWRPIYTYVRLRFRRSHDDNNVDFSKFDASDPNAPRLSIANGIICHPSRAQ